LHPEYRKILNFYLINYSKSWRHVIKCFLKKLPSPEDITEDWILDFFYKYDNSSTKSFYHKMLSIVLGKVGRKHLLKDIRIKEPESKLKQSDLLSPVEVSAMLRACKDPQEKAIIEFLLESGCRAGELLNLEVDDIQPKHNFIIATVRGKTGLRTVPLLRANLTNFLYHLSIMESGRVFPILHKKLRLMLIDLYKRAGVRKRRRTIHIFRHMKATHLLELGTPKSIIRQFMGWSEKSNTTNQYTHQYTHLTSRNIQEFFGRLYGINIEPSDPLYPEEEKERLKAIFG